MTTADGVFSLAWLGEKGLGDYVTSRYEMTRRFYDRLSREPGITCPYRPESNILCFGVTDIPTDTNGLKDFTERMTKEAMAKIEESLSPPAATTTATPPARN